MPLTFQEARDATERALRSSWPPELRPFTTAPWGREDATAYRVFVCPELELADAPLILVDKETGQVEDLAPMDHLERTNAMTPVGEREPG